MVLKCLVGIYPKPERHGFGPGWFTDRFVKRTVTVHIQSKKEVCGPLMCIIFNKSGLTPNTEHITFTFINITGGPCSTGQKQSGSACLFKSLVNQTVIRGL